MVNEKKKKERRKEGKENLKRHAEDQKIVRRCGKDAAKPGTPKTSGPSSKGKWDGFVFISHPLRSIGGAAPGLQTANTQSEKCKACLE